MSDLGRSAWRALRSLFRTRGFAVMTMATLALGIGTTLAMFTVVEGVLLRALPYPDESRVVEVQSGTSTAPKSGYAAGTFLDLLRLNRSFSALAGYRPDLVATTSAGSVPLTFDAAHVTSQFFAVLGTTPELGHVFGSADAGSRQVVLSHVAWQSIYGGATDVVGRTLTLNGAPYTVAGVMPSSVHWPGNTRLWILADKAVPPSPIEHGDDPTSRDVQYFDAIARVRPGLSVALAQADLNLVAATLGREHPQSDASRTYTLIPLRDEIVGDVRPVLLILQAAVIVVLLIACANVSSLVIVRTAGRRRELAIRSALGASRGQILGQLLVESLVLAALGGVLGVLLGAWLVPVLLRLVPHGMMRLEDIALDRTAVFAALGVALVSGLLIGVLPALQASDVNTAATIKDAGERGNAGRTRGRASLVVIEVALTLVLLTGAGLLFGTLVRLERVDSGFRPVHVVVGNLIVPQARYPTGAQQTRLYRRVVEGLQAIGGVEAAGVGFPGPLEGAQASGSLLIEGRAAATGPEAHLASVSGGYFAAMGMVVTSGRAFDEDDRADAPGAVIVNETLARREWPGERALGRRVKFDPSPTASWSTVVGVVSDARTLGLGEAAPAIAYLPYEQFPLPFTTVAVRSTRPEADVTSDMRRVLASLDPALPFAEVTPLSSVIDEAVEAPRFRARLVGVFAALAVILAAVGVYGLISVSVAERTREFGIRLALGARPAQIVLPVLREALGVTLVGLGAGLVAAVGATRVLAQFLFGIGAADPMTILSVSALLLGVTAIASYVPSRRAARVDPLVVLRD